MTSTVGFETCALVMCLFTFGKCIARFMGVTATAKNINKELNFSSFPADKDNEQRNRRKIWIEFSKRKAFKLTANTKICSLHITDDSYDPAHSPKLLSTIGRNDQT